MTHRIAVISDTHSGHRFGLLVPGIKIETLKEYPGIPNCGYWTPELTEHNKHLYNLYMRLVDRAAESKHELTLFMVGELCWGAKYPAGVWDTSIATQVTVGHDCLLPWYKLPKLRRVRIVSGTAVHEFDEGASAAVLIARQLRTEFPKVDTRVVDHALITIEGIRIDAAHHGSSAGQRIWLKGNELRYYLRDRILREIIDKEDPPDLYLRGHYHVRHSEVIDVGDGRERRICIMPSYLMDISAYAKKITKSEYKITNGGALFTIDDGLITSPEWITETLDLRVKEEWN